MSPKAQKIAIAKADGWKLVDTSHYNPPCVLWEHPDDFLKCFEVELPDYVNDLNAIHSAIVRVIHNNRHVRRLYANHLSMICETQLLAIDATAAQRVEAFLRATNLWTT